MDIKKYLEDKGVGFYATLAATLLSVVTAIVYACIYGNTRFMSWLAFALILVGVALAVVLILLKQVKFAPAVLVVMNFISLLLYVYYIYFFISSVMTGIQFSGFPPEFFVNVVFFVLTLVVSIVCVFLPQTKEE